MQARSLFLALFYFYRVKEPRYNDGHFPMYYTTMFKCIFDGIESKFVLKRHFQDLYFVLS